MNLRTKLRATPGRADVAARDLRRHIWLVLLPYGAVLAVLAARHEVWRDEVRALSLAMGSRSLVDLFHNVAHWEGHPLLWYAVLYLGFRVTRSVLVLPLVSLAIATIATYLFVRKSPFQWWQKLLFPFGVFPLYHYSVMCRNYGATMLLLFLYCSLYSRRFERPVAIAVVLALLANTNGHSLILAVAISASLLYEWLIEQREALKRKWLRVVFSFSIVAAGVAFSGVVCYPDKSTLGNNVNSLAAADYAHALGSSLLSIGRVWGEVLGRGTPNAVLTALVFFLGFSLLRKPSLLLLFWGGTLGLSLFFTLFHGGDFHHHGIYFIFVVSVLWMDRLGPSPPPPPPPGAGNAALRVLDRFRDPLLTLGLAVQVLLAYSWIKDDYRFEKTSCKAFAAYLDRHPELRPAIILSEPDYLMEALPYYAGNAIYIPREGRFGKSVSFTTAAKPVMALDELLEDAKRVQREYKTPVLIALGEELRLSREPPFERSFSYNKRLLYSPATLDQFFRETVKMVELNRSISDENFTVYALR